MCRKHVFLIVSLEGWRIGQCNWYRPSPCVFRTAYADFHLDRERRFWSCHQDFRPKMSPINVTWYRTFFSFLGYLGEIEPDSQTVWTCIQQCFQFSTPSLQWLTRFDFKNLYPLFGRPSSWTLLLCRNKMYSEYILIKEIAPKLESYAGEVMGVEREARKTAGLP